MLEPSLAVTVLGINYTPEPTGIAPYTAGLAAGLHERGHRVRVVTAHPHYPQWQVAPGYGGWTSREDVDGVPVTRVRHYVPGKPTGLHRAASEISFGARLTTARWGDPDVLLCVSPALISSAMALGRATHGRRRPATGLIVQDLYSAGIAETGGGGGAVERALTALERRTARRVDGVAVIHDRFKERMERTLGVEAHRVSVVRNWAHVPPVDGIDRDAVRAELGWTGHQVVLHTGAMGEKQSLGTVVEAARVADQRGSDLLFVLLGDGGQRRALEQQAAGLTRIRFLDPVTDEAYARALHAADVLLVNEKPGVVEMAVPSKLTSYFSAGRPVLAATEAASTTAEELAAAGAGVRVDPGDPVGLVTAAAALCGDPVTASALGRRGPTYCARVLGEETAMDDYESWIRELLGRAQDRLRTS